MNVVEEEVSTVMGESTPVAGCGSEPIQPCSLKLSLRCFAYRVRDRLFRAECIDLDIGTEAESLEGAVRGLGNAIYGYLMIVLEDVKTNEDLHAVLRPSPLTHRLRYYLCYLNA
jgi:hypothetical protein